MPEVNLQHDAAKLRVKDGNITSLPSLLEQSIPSEYNPHMIKIYYHGEGIVPVTILNQFKALIDVNYPSYINQTIVDERLECDRNVYRLKFEVFVEPELLVIRILEYIEFEKQ